MRTQTKETIFSTKKVMTVIMTVLLGMNMYGQGTWDQEYEKAKGLVTKEKLTREISFLSDSICTGRATGTAGSIEAAIWIQRRFEDAGLMQFGWSWTRSFPAANGERGRNVIGFLPDAKTIPCDRYIIVGAHFDHLGPLDGKMYPGADANASGTAALTHLAEMFGAMRKMGKILGSNIIFVAFDAKEHGMKGSEALWNLIENGRLTNPLTRKRITAEDISLMVNIDQIGSTLAPLKKNRKDYMIMLGTQSLDKADRNLLDICNKVFETGLDLSLDYYGSANFTKVFYRLSDQRVFVDNKIPAVMFTSGITMNTNKTWDRPESIDMEILKKRIHLIFHWVDRML